MKIARTATSLALVAAAVAAAPASALAAQFEGRIVSVNRALRMNPWPGAVRRPAALRRRG